MHLSAIQGPPNSRQDRVTYKITAYLERLNQAALPFEFVTSFRTENSNQGFKLDQKVTTEAKCPNLVVEDVGSIIITNNVGMNYNLEVSEETVQDDNKKIVEVIYDNQVVGYLPPRDFMKFSFLDYSKLQLRSQHETAYLNICVYPK